MATNRHEGERSLTGASGLVRPVESQQTGKVCTQVTPKTGAGKTFATDKRRVMNTYIADTKYAADGLIHLYTHEIAAYKEAELAFIAGGEGVKNFNAHPLGKDLRQQLDALQQSVDQARKGSGNMFAWQDILKHRQFAYEVLCGGLLQIAKQGISFTYGKNCLATCPTGRPIGSETLRNVIWQGRNQAEHFEEGSFKPAVVQCFANLEKSVGPQFSLPTQPAKNLAAHVIDALKWHTYEAYEKDMAALLGP